MEIKVNNQGIFAVTIRQIERNTILKSIKRGKMQLVILTENN